MAALVGLRFVLHSPRGCWRRTPGSPAACAHPQGPRPPEDRRHRQRQLHTRGGHLRPRLARALAAGLRRLLPTGVDRGHRARPTLSGRRRRLPVDAASVRGRARLPLRLVLLDQQPVLHPDAARLHGRRAGVRGGIGDGGPAQREVVRLGGGLRLARHCRGDQRARAGGRQVGAQRGRVRHRDDRGARAARRRPDAARGRRAADAARHRRQLGDAPASA